MRSLTQERPSREQARDRMRFGGRAAVGLLALALLAQPFLLLLVFVRQRWAPLELLDGAVAAGLNQAANESPVLLGASRAVTQLGGVAFAVYFFLLMTAFLCLRRQRRFAAFSLATGVGVAVLVPLTKALVNRARPVVAMPVAEAPANASFPSGHAMTSVTMWGALVLVALPTLSRRARPWAIVTAVLIVGLVGLSRLVLGVHFVSDIVAGWSLGAAWLAVTVGCFRAWQRDQGNLVADDAALGVADRPATAQVHTMRPALEPSAVATRMVMLASLIVTALTVVGIVVTGPLSNSWLGRMDVTVAEAMVGARNETLNDLAAAGGMLAGVTTVPALVVAVGVLSVAVTDSWRPAMFLTISATGSTSMYLIVSGMVGRSRPDVVDLTSGLPPGTSWPSGHAAAAVTLYGALAALAISYCGARIRPWVPIATAAAVCVVVVLSRLYVAAHHLSDVIAGLALGVAWLLVCVHHLLPHPGSTSAGQHARRRQA